MRSCSLQLLMYDSLPVWTHRGASPSNALPTWPAGLPLAVSAPLICLFLAVSSSPSLNSISPRRSCSRGNGADGLMLLVTQHGSMAAGQHSHRHHAMGPEFVRDGLQGWIQPRQHAGRGTAHQRPLTHLDGSTLATSCPSSMSTTSSLSACSFSKLYSSRKGFTKEGPVGGRAV
jgi:hypothetical protein